MISVKFGLVIHPPRPHVGVGRHAEAGEDGRVYFDDPDGIECQVASA
jgi:hypothetical protein